MNEIEDIENAELEEEDIPTLDAGWEGISQFALSFSGYIYWGSFDKCATHANESLKNWNENETLPSSLTHLRSCLFFEQRRWRHFGFSPDKDAIVYIRALVGSIRNRVQREERGNRLVMNIGEQESKMGTREYLLMRQIQWARNKGIDLIGSKGDRGRPAYTKNLDDNLFEPLNPGTAKSFRDGDGGELAGTPAKMQAVHSSSALGVNIFQFWGSINEIHQIAQACVFCRRTTKISRGISFEVKYPIDDRFRYGPNIDVVIQNTSSSKYKVFAIESKFTEAYGGRGHSGLKKKYLDLDIWEELPCLKELAISISPKDNSFQYLHAAQLIKHILGLKRAYGKTAFRLLYLWYDALGSEGAKHREEIDEFLETAKTDGIAIHELSYQELIVRLAKEYRVPHKEYIKYITDRYL